MEGVVGRVQISEFIRAYNSKPTKLALQAMPSKQRVVAGMVAMIDLHLPGGVGRGAGTVLLRESEENGHGVTRFPARASQVLSETAFNGCPLQGNTVFCNTPESDSATTSVWTLRISTQGQLLAP